LFLTFFALFFLGAFSRFLAHRLTVNGIDIKGRRAAGNRFHGRVYTEGHAIPLLRGHAVSLQRVNRHISRIPAPGFGANSYGDSRHFLFLL
jgi:hypothetical protein